MQLASLHSLPAAVTSDVRVVVLGSMPGSVSLLHQQYYAHPQNRFWRLARDLFSVDDHASYPDRLSSLNRSGVGLWDVLRRCERPGSLDASIAVASEEPNDFQALLRGNPDIVAFAFNGKKAWTSFQRHAAALVSADRIKLHSLPSTSPANAQISYPALLEAWSALLGVVHGHRPGAVSAANQPQTNIDR